MIISNRITIIPIPLINSIDENEAIIMRANKKNIEIYSLNDLDLEERQLKKNGSSYYIQKLKLKIDRKHAEMPIATYLTMPCIIKITKLDGTMQQWGDMKFPVRAVRKSRGNGDEYTLERTSVFPFI